MSLWKIAWRSIQQRGLSSFLTGLSMALGVALVAIVLVIHGVVSRSFSEAAQGYNLIVGAKGGKLQLVLNTVFHLSQPIENIPYSYYEELIPGDAGHKGGKLSRGVDVAIPFCLGDSFDEFRVVATTPEFFEKLSYGSYGERYKCAQGRFFKGQPWKEWYTAVVGSVAARQAHMFVGQKFPITHGLPHNVNAHAHDEVQFEVVGILEPTGTPNDRAIFVNMEGFFKIPDHAKPLPEGDAHADHDHDKAHDAHGAADKHEPAAHDHDKHAEPGKHDEHDKDGHDKDAHDTEKHEAHDKPDAAKSTPGDSPAPKTASGDADKHADHDKDHDADHDKVHEDGHETGPEAGHHHHHHEKVDLNEPLPENQREVTAVLVLMKENAEGLAYSQGLAREVNKGNVAQAVFPTKEVHELMQGMVGNLRLILLVLAVLVVVVAGIGVMVSIYNSMSDRGREIAIMRSLGASRGTVMTVVLLESILLSLLGGVAGVVAAHGLIGALEPWIVGQTGVSVGMFQFEMTELILIPGLIGLAALVGYLPALTAYRTDVAKALSSSH